MIAHTHTRRAAGKYLEMDASIPLSVDVKEEAAFFQASHCFVREWTDRGVIGGSSPRWMVPGVSNPPTSLSDEYTSE